MQRDWGNHPGVNSKARRHGGRVAYYSNVFRDLFFEELRGGKPVSWLDVGAGYGEVVEAVMATFPANSAVLGIEPMEFKASDAQARGLPIKDLPLEEVQGQFDVVSLINVYSHIPEFNSFISQLKPKLKQGGILILETGNVADLPRREDFPDRLYLPDHLVFSGIPQMTEIFARHGLQLVRYMALAIDTPAWCLKLFVKGLLRKRLAIHLPWRSPFRTVIYKAMKSD